MYNFRRIIAYLCILSFLSSCSKDDPQPVPTLSRSEAVLKYDQDVQFRVPNFSNVTWSISDEFIGTVDESGKFTAKHIGEATITAEVDGQNLTGKIVVEPYVTSIVEPSVNFGGSVQSIRDYEKREVYRDDNGFIVYYGQGDLEEYVSYFIYQGLMTNAFINFKFEHSVIQSAMIFYKERYNYLGKLENGREYFESKDRSYRVFITNEDAYYTTDPSPFQ